MKIRTNPIPRWQTLMLTLLMLLSMFPVSAFAANVPTPSSNSYFSCYTQKSSGKVYTCSDASLCMKNGGYVACSTDECQILSVSGDAAYVRYPVPGGTRCGWVPLSTFTDFSLTGNVPTAVATAKITTYRRPGGPVYGSISRNDTVYILGSSGSYTQIVYPVGTKWKLAVITSSNADRYLKSTTPVTTAPTTLSCPLKNGTYVMVPKCAPNSAIEVSNSSLNNGAAVQIWTRAFQNGKILPTMTVRVEVVGNNAVVLYNGNSGKCIDVDSQRKDAGAMLHQWDLPANEKTTRNSAIWLVKSAGNGAYYLINKNSGLAMDVSGASSNNGTRLIQYTPNQSSAQQICFYAADHFNQSSSVQFTPGSSPTLNTLGTKTMSSALYGTSGGRITCGFDGYINTNGRHEGIDFVRGYGSAVYSLTDGVITRVTQGYNGSKGLSTIAIYSASTNKTVVYLHSDPLDSLYSGQQISRGQQIATEAWRGVSKSSGTHTHVEVRNGRCTGAAKSVNDYTLDNQNPTSFWNSQGYQVK